MKLLEKLREGDGLQATVALAAVVGCGMLLPSAVKAQDVVWDQYRAISRTSARCDWHMISLNCNPEKNTIWELYSDNHKGTQCYDTPDDIRTSYLPVGADWAIWADVDDEATAAHTGASVDDVVLLGPDHPLKEGEGYWICVTQRPLFRIDACDNSNDADHDGDQRATTVPCSDYGGEAGKDCAVIDVKNTPDGLDMIGHPFSFTVNWNDHVTVVCNDGTNWAPVPEAAGVAAEGKPLAAQEYGVLSENYFTYNANGYDTYNQVSGVLEPQTGYWVRTLSEYENKCPGGVKLLIQDRNW